MTSYQTLVLSGGGSKGPYGLGVLLALDKFHRERGKEIVKVYCGASVGALNATLAAQGGLAELAALYGRLRTKDILGTNDSRVSKLRMLMVLGRNPFHYFNNEALRKIISHCVDFSRLAGSHLLICATNYTTGEPETFYSSHLVDEFLEKDRRQLPENQRLINYHRIESQEQLVQSLLASTAIPFYLPPVRIRKYLYVDGGVGNNTPLRQAAYICRFLSHLVGASLEPTFCVINDPVRFTIDNADAGDIFGVVRRTLGIFHNELISDSHMSWERINKEVAKSADRENLIFSHIDALEELQQDSREALRIRISGELRGWTTATPRCQLPLMVVRPKTPLVDDILNFDTKVSKRLKEHGVADCLELLEHKNFITHNDLRRWNEEIE